MTDEEKLLSAGEALADISGKVENATDALLPLVETMCKSGFHQVAAIMLNDFAQKFGAIIQEHANIAAQKKEAAKAVATSTPPQGN